MVGVSVITRAGFSGSDKVYAGITIADGSPVVRVQDFQDLEVWQVSMDLAAHVLEASSTLPAAERFGIRAQMRNAAVSIPSNIAEGYGRGTRLDYLRFLRFARGSACELHTLLLLVQRMQYLQPPKVHLLTSHVDRVRAMLHRLMKSLE